MVLGASQPIPTPAGAMNPFYVEEINRVEHLAEYRLWWNAALAHTRGATFLQSLDWLEVYWRHFGAGQKLRVLVVKRQREVLGIVPLVVRDEPTGIGSVRVLTYPLYDWGTIFGPVGPNPTATLSAAMHHLRGTPRDWDMIDLRWIDLQGTDHRRTEHAMRRAGFRPRPRPWSQTSAVDLDQTWQSYWTSRPAPLQDRVSNARRRLARRGNIRLLRYRPEGKRYGQGDPQWDLYETCVALAGRSEQATLSGRPALPHAHAEGFLRDAHALAAQAGALDLNLLLLDETPVAFAYNYHYGGRVHGLLEGIDPSVGAMEAGSVLRQLVLQDSIRRGDTTYDLGTGGLDAKQGWRTHLATRFRYTHLPRSISRAQVLRWKHWLQERRTA